VTLMTWSLIALGGFAGCGNAGGAAAGQGTDQLAALRDNPDALIQMRKGDCAPDHCSVYSVSIFADGSVTYDGRANVAVVGQRRAKISADRLSELISAIDAMDFLDLPASGCVCSASTGRQMVTVDYRPGSVQKTVVHDSGCWSAPPALGALEATIDRLTGDSQWIAPQMALREPLTPSSAPAVSIAPPEAPASAAAAPGTELGAEPGKEVGKELGTTVSASASSQSGLPLDSSAIAPPNSPAAP
jgi:hypothetical protein